MANYYGKGRTNTFLVNDVQALKAALEGSEFVVRERPERGLGAVFLTASDSDGAGCWGQLVNVDGQDEPEELFVPDIIAAHLQDGQVAVFVHAGAEKLCYISAYSIAVHSSGQQVRIDINDVYRMAAQAFRLSADEIDSATD
ncbi:hypothetical protein [Mycolicibacterium frederiksbergense]|uniref:Uncharacterized protein n=1 Tax=Mycolicibacterium frederiksbergense TaxID=117567 RepID=A0A6H0RYE8_9MYCO|nr:hypothetical protein [Mycolicibacterium frederiksbergense]QIV79511.1 hypothetical protein EXE63_00215 [Mycolicibacterium frederiksbergense]